MADGDFAGLCVFLEKYGQIGIRQRNGKKSVVMRRRVGETAPYELQRKGDLAALEEWYTTKETEAPFDGESVWLRIVFRFDSWGSQEETAEFFYSLDGERFSPLGEKLDLLYSLSIFVGVRIGIFSYNEGQGGAGFSDFRDFVADENCEL